jgi:hypothetical protein
MKGTFATTETDGDGYLILIDKGLRTDFACYVLAHDFAHAVSFTDCDDDDHGPAFWHAYKDCFDVYVDWCKE